MIGLVTGTYQRLPYLQSMVISARTSARNVPIHFYIVDGGSTDGTLEWCQEQEDVTLVRQGQLLGATRAFMEGFKANRYPFVVVANDDVEFVDDTILRSLVYLQDNPKCGAVAYRNRTEAGEYVMYPYGYATPQCGMVRWHVGNLAGWWNITYHTYAADTELGLRIWELGLTVDEVPGCTILDKHPTDELREHNKGVRPKNEDHPDNVLFKKRWNGRMPPHSSWLSMPKDTLWQKARLGKLRTLRFKIHPPNSGPARTGMIRAFAKLGEAEQVITDDYARRFAKKPDKFQLFIEHEVDAFEPDLVLFQIHGIGNVLPATIHKLRALYPDTIFVNFNGDVRNEVEQILIDTAKECHLTLLPSPDLFAEYHSHGAYNVAYWPIAVDPEWLGARRGKEPDYDVVFLGSHYPTAGFPLAQERYDIVEALVNSGLRVGVFGFGWPDAWKARYTADDTPTNIGIYERAELAVSVSQFNLTGYTSDRLYRICATGCPAVVMRFKGMEQHGFIDGENCFVFDDHTTVVDVCRAALDPLMALRRSEVGAAGKRLIAERHNYEKRIDELLLMLERY